MTIRRYEDRQIDVSINRYDLNSLAYFLFYHHVQTVLHKSRNTMLT